MTQQELLAVLDMSEDEQVEWVENNCEMEGWESKSSGFIPVESLADLAFRLRGEINKITNWWDACQSVYEYVVKEKFDENRGWKSETGIWFQDFAKPIHWIIAALIAKEKDNETS